jgi:hypothetical protein
MNQRLRPGFFHCQNEKVVLRELVTIVGDCPVLQPKYSNLDFSQTFVQVHRVHFLYTFPLFPEGDKVVGKGGVSVVI